MGFFNFVSVIISITPLVHISFGAPLANQCRMDGDCVHGVCVNDRCFCSDFWGGDFCDQSVNVKPLTSESSPQVDAKPLPSDTSSQSDNVGPCAADADCSGHGKCMAGLCYCAAPFFGARCGSQNPELVEQPIRPVPSNFVVSETHVREISSSPDQLPVSNGMPEISAGIKTADQQPSEGKPSEEFLSKIKVALRGPSKSQSAGLLAAVRKSGQKHNNVPMSTKDPVIQQIAVYNHMFRFAFYILCILAILIISSVVLYVFCCVDVVRERFLFLLTGDKEVRWTLASSVQAAYVVEITDIDVTDLVCQSWFGQADVFMRVTNNPNMPIRTNMKKPKKYSKGSHRVYFDRIELNVWPSGDDIKIDIMEQDFIGSDVVGQVTFKSNEVLEWANGADPRENPQATISETGTGSTLKGMHSFKMKNPDGDMVATLHCNFYIVE